MMQVERLSNTTFKVRLSRSDFEYLMSNASGYLIGGDELTSVRVDRTTKLVVRSAESYNGGSVPTGMIVYRFLVPINITRLVSSLTYEVEE